MENEKEIKHKKTKVDNVIIENPVKEIENIKNSYVFIPDQCTAFGRSEPSGVSNIDMYLHNNDVLYVDGFRNNGMWTWYHDTRGFWIESKQVVCLIDVKEV